MKRRFIFSSLPWRLGVLAFVFLFASTAGAHPLGFSGLGVVLKKDHAHVALTLHTRDLSGWFPPGTKYPNYVPDICRYLDAHSDEALDFRIDGNLLAPSKIHAFSPETGMIQLDLDYPLPAAPKQLEIW